MKELLKQTQTENVQKKSFNSHFQENSSVNGLQHKNVKEMDLITETLLFVVKANEKPTKDFYGCIYKIKESKNTLLFF
jgi:hypothetical protein